MKIVISKEIIINFICLSVFGQILGLHGPRAKICKLSNEFALGGFEGVASSLGGGHITVDFYS